MGPKSDTARDRLELLHKGPKVSCSLGSEWLLGALERWLEGQLGYLLTRGSIVDTKGIPEYLLTGGRLELLTSTREFTHRRVLVTTH
jgi:hypothetical protein